MIDLRAAWWLLKFIVKIVGGSILINMVTAFIVIYCLVNDKVFRSDTTALIFWLISSSILASLYGVILAA